MSSKPNRESVMRKGSQARTMPSKRPDISPANRTLRAGFARNRCALLLLFKRLFRDFLQKMEESIKVSPMLFSHMTEFHPEDVPLFVRELT